MPCIIWPVAIHLSFWEKKQKKNKTSCLSIFRVIFGGCNNARARPQLPSYYSNIPIKVYFFPPASSALLLTKKVTMKCVKSGRKRDIANAVYSEMIDELISRRHIKPWFKLPLCVREGSCLKKKKNSNKKTFLSVIHFIINSIMYARDRHATFSTGLATALKVLHLIFTAGEPDKDVTSWGAA